MKMGMLLYNVRTERERDARQAETIMSILEGQELPVFPPSVVCEVVPSGEMIRWYFRQGIHSTTLAIISLTSDPRLRQPGLGGTNPRRLSRSAQ